MKTWLRRLLGLALLAAAPWFYLTLNVRHSLSCERPRGTCTHQVEQSGRTISTYVLPVTDVLGAYYQPTHWEESPRARELLSRAQSLDDVKLEDLYDSSRRRGSGQRVVIYTRRGLLPLAEEFDSNNKVDVHGFNSALADPRRAAFGLVEDSVVQATVSGAVPALVGLVLVFMPRQRPEFSEEG